MANIKNMPSFYLDDDQNENFPSKSEVVKKPPLTPSFIVNGKITLEDCKKEVDRIIKNIDSMEDYDVITNAQKNIMYNILKSISPYTLSDLGHLPKEEQDSIVKETASKIREFYHSNLTPEKLLKDFETFSFIFENLCIRDLLVYSSCVNGEVLYYFPMHDKYIVM